MEVEKSFEVENPEVNIEPRNDGEASQVAAMMEISEQKMLVMDNAAMMTDKIDGDKMVNPIDQ